MSDKAINIKVDEQLYKQVKIKVATEDITIKDYIIKLIQKDLNENK
jgi:predicted DNA binding CopG/RHH family protein